MTDQEIADFCTDMIYLGLFDANAADLRTRLGLPAEDTPDDDNLRDHMGEMALRAISDVESSVTQHIKITGCNSLDELFATIGIYTVMAARKYKIKAVAEGIDFLTGRKRS